MKSSELLRKTPITVALAHELLTEIHELYHYIYTYELNYDEYIDKGDELLKSMAFDEKLKSLIRALVEVRHDIFSSDREVACLYLVLREKELIEEEE